MINHIGRLYAARRRFHTTTAVVRHQRGGCHGTAQLGLFCVCVCVRQARRGLVLKTRLPCDQLD